MHLYTILPAVLVRTTTSSIAEILPYRPPDTCEKNVCVSTTDFCSERLDNVYRYLGRPCAAGSTCTDCEVLAPYGAVRCRCEQTPFATTATYGQACGLTARCSEGECFRPCATFLTQPDCASDRCVWDLPGRVCLDVVAKPPLPQWTVVAPPDLSEETRGELIVNATNPGVFDIELEDFVASITGYSIGGEVRLTDLVSGDDLFMLLDQDLNGYVNETEWSLIPNVLGNLATLVDIPGRRRLTTTLIPPLTGEDILQCLNLTDASPPSLVTACAAPDLQGQICRAQSGKFYCLADQTCVTACADCAWLRAEDLQSHRCVAPTPGSCKAIGKMYCSSSASCLPFGDCTECNELVFADTVRFTCLAAWWGNTPSALSADWVCRDRKGAGMSCRSDQDCVAGTLMCVGSTCEPITTGVCATDRDCAIGFYCPPDPTGGEDPFYTQDCKPQKADGETCTADSECVGTSRCNSFDDTCRSLFSLPPGTAVSDPFLCDSGQVGSDGATCSVPYGSRRLAQACVADADCLTTDPSGSVAECSCRNWWDDNTQACKACVPVFGDFGNYGESLRNYLYNRGVQCGSVWTESECLREKPKVQSMWKQYMCEEQRLRGGLVAVPEPCVDDSVVDYCA